MRKAISMLCSLTMLIMLFAGLATPTTVFAQTSGNFAYTVLDDDTVKITDYTGTATELVIPDTLDGHKVTSIGNFAFEKCHSLTSVTFPDSVTSIESYAFQQCGSLADITLGNGVTSIGGYAFYYTSLEDLTIPDSVTNIGRYAFAYSSLTSVTLPDSVTSIEEGVFSNCSSLKCVTFGDHVTHIGCSAFSFCASLKNITLPQSVTNIENYAFEHCESLVSFTIPESVTDIGTYAFHWCTSLVDITLGESVTQIGKYAFSNCVSLMSVTIPKCVMSIGIGAFTLCNKLTAIEVSEDNTVYCDVDGVLFTKDKAKLIVFPGGKRAMYVVPDGVTHIGEYAFADCDHVISITLPNSVTDIGGYAFYRCRNLSCVSIPVGVTNVGEYTFQHSSELQDILYGGSKNQWATIVIGDYNDSVTNARIHYNASGEHWELVEVCSPNSCTEDGSGLYTCDCGYEAERVIPATGHELCEVETVEPTCTAQGYTLYECTVCEDEVYGDYTVAGHTFRNNICIGCDQPVAQCLASEHKYANDCDESWMVYQVGAESITLTFSSDTETDDGYDFIYLYDGDNILVGTYTGKELADKVITVDGDFVKIRLVSDESMTYYGFAVTDVCAKYPFGDISEDGSVDTTDVAMVFYSINGGIALTPEQYEAADLNGDGVVNLFDAARLFYMVNGLI